MGRNRKRSSHYASRVGKRSKGRRGFKGTLKTNVNTGAVNNGEMDTLNNVNIVNVNSEGSNNNGHTLPSTSTSTSSSTPTTLNQQEKSSTKIAEQRKFKKLENISLNKIRRNSSLVKSKYHIPTSSSQKRRRKKTALLYSKAKDAAIIDCDILNSVLSSSTCCFKCKKKGLCLEKFNRDVRGLW